MPFKTDLRALMEQFGGPINALASVQGVVGVVFGVVYLNPEEADPTDEVALVIVPKRAHMEKALIEVMSNALLAHLQSQAGKVAGKEGN